MIDLGTGNNNKINWAMEDKQEMIDIIETVYRGARKGRGLVVSPKDYSTKYRYWRFFADAFFLTLHPLKFIIVYVCTYIYIKRKKKNLQILQLWAYFELFKRFEFCLEK